jgi:serine/threonine protein phosphatase PrpC
MPDATRDHALAAPRSRRRRLARGPLVIGEPAAAVEPRLALAEPYRPDTVADGGAAFGMTVRAASVRGLAKRWSGGPRQDDLCIGMHAPSRTLIVAVADGVSAAARSHLGAALAVRQAVAAVARALERGAEVDWDEIFRHAAWALVEARRAEDAAAGVEDAAPGVKEAAAHVEEAARTLACTLLVAAVTAADQDGGAPSARVAAVGDSSALLLAAGRYVPLLGAREPVDGLAGRAVAALPRAADEVRSTSLALFGDDVLLLATDGFTMPLADGRNDVGAVFARELRRAPSPLELARLLDFSRSTYDDDRTLVAIWPPRER